MNRFRNGLVRAALLAVLLLGMTALGCGDDEQARQTQSATPSAPERDTQPASTVSDEQPQEAQSSADEPPSDEVEEQPQVAVQQAQQESTEETSQAAQSPEEEIAAEPEPQEVTLTLRPILNGHQFHQPIEMLELPDGSLLVAEQRGYITRFEEDDGEVKQFGILDLTESITFRGEQGLLSMALDPNLEREPFLYVYYSPRGESITRLSRFRIVQDAALPASELVIIEVPQPYSNHNGGAVRFGPDGMLYLGLGDGGAANDPQGHGQNRETLLGTIIRIDVDDIDTSTPYRIPTDNPFLGFSRVRPEIWAYGLRNPWRMAFDPVSGLLWVGDVGQDRVEEIAIVQAGENHGWHVFEGDECFRSEDDCNALPSAVAPVGTYGHDEGCSVTGGMVYRGEALQQLVGAYIFGDFCSGTIWALWPDHGADTGWWRVTLLESNQNIASFAVDGEGEIYVLVFNGPILKLAAERD